MANRVVNFTPTFSKRSNDILRKYKEWRAKRCSEGDAPQAERLELSAKQKRAACLGRFRRREARLPGGDLRFLNKVKVRGTRHAAKSEGP